MILNNTYNEKLSESFDMLNEQYYGKSPTLMKIDSLFEEIIQIFEEIRPAKKDPTPKLMERAALLKASQISKIDILLKSISKLYARQFNFKSSFLIHLDPSFSQMMGPNACVFPGTQISKMRKAKKYPMENYKYGIRYKTKVEAPPVVITYQMLSLFRPGEGSSLTATILHEIGHMFYYDSAINIGVTKVSIFGTLLLNIKKSLKDMNDKDSLPTNKQIAKNNVIQTILQMITQTEIFNAGMTKLMHLYFKVFSTQGDGNDIQSTNAEMLNKQSITLNASQVVMFFIQGMTGIAGFAKKVTTAPVRIAVGALTGTSGYRDEQFADNFATMHGYGSDFMKTFKKFDEIPFNYVDAFLRRSKLYTLMQDVLMTQNSILLGFDDVHPNNIARCMDQLKFLQDQAKNLTNPEEKKMLDEDISKALKSLNDYKASIEHGELAKTGRVVSSFIQKIRLKLKGGVRYLTTKKSHYKDGNYEILPESTSFDDELNMDELEEYLMNVDEDELLLEYTIAHYIDSELDQSVLPDQLVESLMGAGAKLTIRALPELSSNLWNKTINGNKIGDIDILETNLLKILNKCKTSEEVKYIKKDCGVTKTLLAKIIENIKYCEKTKPEDVKPGLKKLKKKVDAGKFNTKDLEQHIKWIDTVYKKALNDKYKELVKEGR